MRTFVYVDGFNLYHRALEHTPYRWLDIKKLISNMLNSSNVIERVNYYSARVSDRGRDGSSARQQMYVRALKTIPEIAIHWGSFLTHETTMIRSPITKPKQYVKVLRTEEKGSDVNLASHLIYDGCKNLYDVAIVISNDTDLKEPIRIVRHELKKVVGIFCPAKNIAEPLRNIPPSFVRHISQKDLRSAQFPIVIPNTNIECPKEWLENSSLGA